MKASRIFSLFMIVLAGIIAYSNTFNSPFLFDDDANIADNPLIKNLDNFIFPSGAYKGYLPRAVGLFSFALNYHFGGLDVTGYHLVNLIIHISNAILIYFLVVLTFKTPYFGGQGSGVRGQGLLIALFSALLFVSHPVQTQAVTYIVQRLTSLAAMFYLLSVVMYITARLITQEGIGKGQGARGSKNAFLPFTFYLLPIACFVLSLVSAILAMLTKEMSFTLPIVIILYEFTFFESSLKRKLLFLLPLLLTLIIIPLGIMGIDKPLGEILSDVSERIRVQTDMSRWDYLFTQFRVIVTYIRLFFLPINQNLDYDYPVYHSLFALPVFLSLLLLLSILGIAVYLLFKSRQEAIGNGQWEIGNNPPASPLSLRGEFKGGYRLIAFGIFWFFITLSVESSIIPIVDVIFEHRVYLPSVGGFIVISSIFFIITEKLNIIKPANKYCNPSFPLVGNRTAYRAENKERFRTSRNDSVRVFNCRVNRWPQINKAALSLFTLIIIALSTATYARNSVWRDELSLWEDVVKKSPRKARGQNNLGAAYGARGLTDKAIEHLQISLRLEPEYADTYNNLGNVYMLLEKVDQAIEQYRTALKADPAYEDAHYNLGFAYLRKGVIEQALEHFETAARLRPEDPELRAAYSDLYNMMKRLRAVKGVHP